MNGRLNFKFKRIWKIAVVPQFLYVPRGTVGIRGSFSRESCCSGNDSNRTPPEYKSTAFPVGQPAH
jgi:hypothetical protein